MREIGVLVWVGLLIIGVIGSMVSSLRKQAQAPSQGPRPAPRPQPPPEWLQQMVAQMPPQARVVQVVRPQATPKPVAAAPVPVPPPRAPAVPHEPAASHPQAGSNVERGRPQITREIFARRNIVQAVIAAEVLGKPRALSDEYFPR